MKIRRRDEPALVFLSSVVFATSWRFEEEEEEMMMFLLLLPWYYH